METCWRTATGEVLVTEFMAIGGSGNALIRRVQGLPGHFLMRQELVCGSATERWCRRSIGSTTTMGRRCLPSPDRKLCCLGRMHCPKLDLIFSHVGEFTLEAGQTLDLQLQAFASSSVPPPAIDVGRVLQTTATYWRSWSNNYLPQGNYDREVERS